MTYVVSQILRSCIVFVCTLQGMCGTWNYGLHEKLSPVSVIGAIVWQSRNTIHLAFPFR